MKKLLSLLLLLALTLCFFVSCKDDASTPDNTQGTPDASTPDTTVARIGYLPGTTALGMAKMVSDADSAYTYTKYNGATYIATALMNGEIDIAAYPTNGVPNLSSKVTGGVQYLAINTLGVLYLCTNGVTVNSLNDLAGKTVYVPEQSPKMILEYILEKKGIENVTIQMSSLDLLPGQIVSGENSVQIALLPEPKVTAAANTAKAQNVADFAVSSVDLNAAWNEVSDTPLVQGCVVVRTEFAAAHPEVVKRFLTSYEASITYIKNPENLDAAAQIVAETGILPAVPVAKSAIPRSNLTYLAGADMKAAAAGFLAALGIQFPDTGYFLGE